MALLFLKSASTTTFLRHVMHHKPLPAIAPRFLCTTTINGSSSSSSDDDNEEETKNAQPHTVPTITIRGPPRAFTVDHPFQVKGSKSGMVVDETNQEMLVRVTLPGVSEKRCDIHKGKDTIFVLAEGIKGLEPEPEPKPKPKPRRYAFSLEFNPELHDAEKASSSIKNGILRLMIPKVGAKMEEEDEDERKIVPFAFDEKEE